MKSHVNFLYIFVSFCIFLSSSTVNGFSNLTWRKSLSPSSRNRNTYTNKIHRVLQNEKTSNTISFFPANNFPKKTGYYLFSSPNGDEEVNDSYDERDLTLFEQIITATGLVSAPLTLYSEYVLKTTGCGLPAGPFGLIGAAEGISYLVVVYIVGWSLYTKITTGKGLPAGNGGLLGAAEGLAYLSILTGLVVFGFQIKDYGFIPEPVPVEGGRCSGI